ncbi:hypothetical protein Cgig2_001585 [Carnegiea gigantea]|uniref:Uncharacterized protein n=1 Tax=Carnegiea gigantea TaxID=171969 RepID=A0A9Q1QH57_9CARY|nr:hypothetical protein Cgig2_001585 [Carnegiea gigantea]
MLEYNQYTYLVSISYDDIGTMSSNSKPKWSAARVDPVLHHYVRSRLAQLDSLDPPISTPGNFMTTMTDTFLQQVTEQVKKTMEVVSFMRPLPTFDYVPTTGCGPFHKHAPIESLRRSGDVREIARLERNGRSRKENNDRSVGGDAWQIIQARQALPAA